MKPERNIRDTEEYLNKLLAFYKNRIAETNDDYLKIFIGSKIQLINNILDQIDFIKEINEKKEEIEESLKSLEV